MSPPTVSSLRQWRYFVKAVDCGSLSGVAEFFRTDVSFVSRELRELDLMIGEPLLERDRRGVKPTWLGIMRYREAKELLKQADDICTANKKKTKETIRTAVPLSLSPLFSQWAAAFATTQAGKKSIVDIEPYSSLAPLDMVEFDCYVCEDSLPNVRMIAKQLGALERAVVASSEFLKTEKPIRVPEDLEGRRLIASRSGRCLMIGKQESCAIWIDPAVRVKGASSLVAAAQTDTGYAVGVPLWQIQHELKAGVLTDVLPSWKLALRPVWLLRRPESSNEPDVRSLVRFFEECWAKTPGLIACRSDLHSFAASTEDM